MRPSESTYPGDWRRIADKDLERTERMLEADDPEAAGFYLEQSLEKYFKAFLLSKGWSLKRIHDLEVLLNDALSSRRQRIFPYGCRRCRQSATVELKASPRSDWK